MRSTLLPLTLSVLAALPGQASERLRPAAPFDVGSVATAPDYGDPAAWAALPDRQDAPDIYPRGAADRQSEAAVDVFFVHPTTHLRGERWNADVHSEAVNTVTDTTSMRNQASAFNSAGRIYAPRYRQAILYAYLHHDGDSLAARDLAYSDVVRAFDHYLSHFRDGRPVILAGHSQGAHHLLRLLEEHEAARSLKHDIVAVYLIGVPFPSDKFETTLAPFRPCETPAETECIVSWNTVAPDADRRRFKEVRLQHGDEWRANGERSLACTNPLSWRAHESTAAAPIPLAAVPRSREGDPRRTAGPPEARCVDGLLAITPPPGRAFRLTSGRRGDYHVYDVPLFHMNLRRNARTRALAHLSSSRPR